MISLPPRHCVRRRFGWRLRRTAPPFLLPEETNRWALLPDDMLRANAEAAAVLRMNRGRGGLGACLSDRRGAGCSTRQIPREILREDTLRPLDRHVRVASPDKCRLRNVTKRPRCRCHRRTLHATGDKSASATARVCTPKACAMGIAEIPSHGRRKACGAARAPPRCGARGRASATRWRNDFVCASRRPKMGPSVRGQISSPE